jgi:hypothetical protein
MTELLQQLNNANEAGELLTFDVQTSAWAQWRRYVYFVPFIMYFDQPIIHSPLRHFQDPKRQPVAIAASGLANIDDHLLPLCPHAANPVREEGYGMMRARFRKVNGRKRWVFVADHECKFIGEYVAFIL